MYNEEEAARPYARALVHAAMALKAMAQIREDVASLQAQWEGSEPLRDWAKRHRSLPRAQHRALIASIWGESLSHPVLALLEALSEHGRLALIPQVICCFRRLADAAEHRLCVSLDFAAEPSPDTLARLTERARQAYGPQTQVQHRVRPELGAGLIIRAGHTQFDGSLAGRLRRLTRACTR